MAKEIRTWTVTEIAAAIQAEVIGDGEKRINRPVPAGYTDPAGITFAESEKFLAQATSVEIGAIIVPPGTPALAVPTLVHPSPRQAFAMILGMSQRAIPIDPGIHPTALVHESAEISLTAKIGAFVTIGPDCFVGDDAEIHSHCYLGDSCEVGSGSILYARVTVYQDVRIGKDCVIHSGAVLGAEGFGFVWTGKEQYKIPQVGGIVIGDNVEIGANTCIDRATSGDTVVANGVKIDNLCQIGHNTKIGEHTVIASQVGIAGSSTIGERVTIGGQAGVSDHTNIGDDIVLAGRAGAISDLDAPGAYVGMPAIPYSQGMRMFAVQAKLPELSARVRKLEKDTS